MGIFRKLLSLHGHQRPVEDFFTEIVAHHLQRNPKLVVDWLRIVVSEKISKSSASRISRQSAYSPLEHHATGSRPDMVVELTDGVHQDIVFIESKVGSKEGVNQLQQYAEILKCLPTYRHRYLLYVTRDYDPKSEFHSPDAVEFSQSRWYEFYQLLQRPPETHFGSEIKKFMEEYGMARNAHFSTINLLSMMNFHQSIALMESCLDGEVRERFNEVFNNSPKNWRRKALEEFRYHGRFILYAHLQVQQGIFWGHVGFFGMKDGDNSYPCLRIQLEVSPDCSDRAQIISLMSKLHLDPDMPWQGYLLNDPNSWSRLQIETSMQSILSELDHVTAIQKFFLQGLNAVQDLKTDLPELHAMMKR